MSTTQQLKKPSAQPSPKLAALLAKATPAEREQAIKMAAALLNKRAEREAKGNGKVDLTTYENGAGAGTTMDTASDEPKGDTARLEPGNDSVRMSLTPENGLDERQRQQEAAQAVMGKPKAAERST